MMRSFEVNMIRYFAGELAGTFVLTSMVLLSVGDVLPGRSSFIPTPVVAAVTLGALVYFIGVIGKLSDAHFNPAITFGTLIIGKKRMGETFGYIIAQIIGALGARYFLSLFLTPPSLLLRGGVTISWMEAFGAFIFAMGVAVVAHGWILKKWSGAVVGFALLVGILAAAHVSHGVLNPAVAGGLGLFNLDYALGPMFGAALGMLAISRLAGTRSK